MQEQNSFTIILKSKQFNIPIIFENLLHINQDIISSLIIHHQYQIKVNVDESILTLFLDFLIHNQNVIITPENQQSFSQLNDEFQFQPLHDLIRRHKFIQKFNTKFANYDIIEELIQSTTKDEKSNKNDDTENFQDLIEETISKNLDDYLNFYGKDLLKLPIEILKNVFNHPKRKLDNHNLAYKKIRKNFNENKNIQIFSLLSFLDSNKLESKYLRESILKRKERANQIPKIDVIQILDKNDEKNDNQRKLLNFFLPKNDEFNTKLINIITSSDCDNSETIQLLVNNQEIEDDCGLSFKINETDKTATVFKVLKNKEKFVIPNYIDYKGEKYLVTTIHQPFKDLQFIKTVEFNDNSNLKIIDESAFENSSIEFISIPSSVIKIGSKAFYNCQKLKKVDIKPSSELKYIGKHAFATTSIESIYIPSNVQKIKHNTFFKCSNLQKVEIPSESNLKCIGRYSFHSTSINTINIPSKVTTIGEGAFVLCDKLKTLNFSPDSKLSLISDCSFLSASIVELIINSEFIYMGENVFGQCENIKKVEISKQTKLAEIGSNSFHNSSIESLIIQSEILNIRDYAFLGCKNLKIIEISKNTKIATIGKMAFENSSIEKLIVDSEKVFIKDNAFQSTYSLKTVQITENVKIANIGIWVFFDSKIENFLVESEKLILGEYTFYLCHNLTKIEISKCVKTAEFGKCLFYSTTIEQITISSENIKIGKYAFSNSQFRCINISSKNIKIEDNWCYHTKKLTQIIIPSDIKDYLYKNDGILLGKTDQLSDNYDIILFARRDIKNIKIPSNIKIVSSSSFDRCTELESIEFDELSELQTIDSYAFSSTKIKSISIPSHVTKLKNGAFSGCQNLKLLDLSKCTEKVALCKNLFNSSNVECIKFPSKEIELENGWQNGAKCLTQIIIPNENQNYIYKDDELLLGKTDQSSDNYDIILFARRDIKNIKIPSKIKIISPYSFHKCTKLKTIEFDKSSELRKIGAFAFSSTKIKLISIPLHVTTIGEDAFNCCCDLKAITFSESSELNELNMNSLYDTNITALKIPPLITSIEEDVFSNFEKLQIIEISENSQLKSINAKMFEFSPVQIIMIPPKLKDLLQI